MSQTPLNLGIAGFGTVGSGLVRILSENRNEILARTGRDIRVKRILVRDPSRPRACPLPHGTSLTANADDILNDPDIHIAVELMGGVEEAGAFIKRALEAGKDVVTANKALLAETGSELFALAEKMGRHLGYEASVCGGIPIVQTLRESLAGNRLESLLGILNGTSNYILSQMSSEGLAFAEALKSAQELGYAEADPTLDIEGFDAAHKLALLIRLGWGAEYPYAALPVRGISNVQPEDIAYAREFGYRIKLIGHARLVDGGIEGEVCPTLVPTTSLLSSVSGAYNAVHIEGNAVGSLFLHGKGAGDMPTGSAVAADILAIARKAAPNNTGFTMPHLPHPAKIVPRENTRSHYYIRLKVSDEPGVLRDIAAVMAENDISIAQVIQKNAEPEQNAPGTAQAECGRGNAPGVPFIVMTHEARAAGVENALKRLSTMPILHEKPVFYRVLAAKE